MRYYLLSVFLVLLFTNCSGQNKPACIETFKASLQNIEEGRKIEFAKVDCVQWDKVLIVGLAFNREMVETYVRSEKSHPDNLSCGSVFRCQPQKDNRG